MIGQLRQRRAAVAGNQAPLARPLSWALSGPSWFSRRDLPELEISSSIVLRCKCERTPSSSPEISLVIAPHPQLVELEGRIHRHRDGVAHRGDLHQLRVLQQFSTRCRFSGLMPLMVALISSILLKGYSGSDCGMGCPAAPLEISSGWRPSRPAPAPTGKHDNSQTPVFCKNGLTAASVVELQRASSADVIAATPGRIFQHTIAIRFSALKKCIPEQSNDHTARRFAHNHPPCPSGLMPAFCSEPVCSSFYVKSNLFSIISIYSYTLNKHSVKFFVTVKGTFLCKIIFTNKTIML